MESDGFSHFEKGVAGRTLPFSFETEGTSTASADLDRSSRHGRLDSSLSVLLFCWAGLRTASLGSRLRLCLLSQRVVCDRQDGHGTICLVAWIPGTSNDR